MVLLWRSTRDKTRRAVKGAARSFDGAPFHFNKHLPPLHGTTPELLRLPASSPCSTMPKARRKIFCVIVVPHCSAEGQVRIARSEWDRGESPMQPPRASKQDRTQPTLG